MSASAPEIASWIVLTIAASAAGAAGLSSVAKPPCVCECPAAVVQPSVAPVPSVVSARPAGDGDRVRALELVAGSLEAEQKKLKATIDEVTAAEKRK